MLTMCISPIPEEPQRERPNEQSNHGQTNGANLSEKAWVEIKRAHRADHHHQEPEGGHPQEHNACPLSGDRPSLPPRPFRRGLPFHGSLVPNRRAESSSHFGSACGPKRANSFSDTSVSTRTWRMKAASMMRSMTCESVSAA